MHTEKKVVARENLCDNWSMPHAIYVRLWQEGVVFGKEKSPTSARQFQDTMGLAQGESTTISGQQ